MSPAVVPEPFLLEEVQLVKAHRTKDRLSVALNSPFTVVEAFNLFKQAAKEAGFELVGQDNEGFEAEIYLRKGKELGAIQVRTSRCEDASVVFINIVRT